MLKKAVQVLTTLAIAVWIPYAIAKLAGSANLEDYVLTLWPYITLNFTFILSIALLFIALLISKGRNNLVLALFLAVTALGFYFTIAPKV